MRRNALFSLLASGSVCLALASVGEATVPRAFVSVSGSDTDSCLASDPCRSFNRALMVVDPGGEIVVKDSGGYSSGFSITKSVTIDAGAFNASVMSTSTSPTDLCTIKTGPDDTVVLRGISFHGANIAFNAIAVIAVRRLYVEHCSITGFTADGVHMTNGGDLYVTNTDVRGCNNDGLLVASTDTTPASLIAQDSRFSECHGAAVSVECPGLFTAGGSVTNCTASACFTGFRVVSQSSTSALLTVINCRAFGGAISGFSAISSGKGGGAAMFISNCVAIGNATGISTTSSGGGVAQVTGTSPGTSLISGNGTDGSTTSSVTLQ